MEEKLSNTTQIIYPDDFTLEFKIPYLPPSINSAYKINHSQRRMYLSKKGGDFKFLAKTYMPSFKVKEGALLSVGVEYFGNWHTKEGKVRKADGMNLDKLLYDAISERLGVDDSRFFKWSGEKIQSDTDYCMVKIKEIR
jgi:Holliday junction resolvase RusA-like endonuclease